MPLQFRYQEDVEELNKDLKSAKRTNNKQKTELRLVVIAKIEFRIGLELFLQIPSESGIFIIQSLFLDRTPQKSTNC